MNGTRSEPVNPYGRSKVAGEHNVRALWRKHYIVEQRGSTRPVDAIFIHAILRFAAEARRVRVVTDEIGNPTNVADLAAAIKQLMTTGQYGTNFVNSGVVFTLGIRQREFASPGGSGKRAQRTDFEQRIFDRASTPPPLGALNNNVGAAIGITCDRGRMRWRTIFADNIPERRYNREQT